MSERLPERTVTDMVGEALTLLQRAPLFLLGPFFVFELTWNVAMQAFERVVGIIGERAGGDMANLPQVMKLGLIALGSLIAALIVLVILYSYLLAISQLAAREAMEGRKITLPVALAHARTDVFPTMSSLGWFSAVYSLPLLIVSAATALMAGGSIGFGALLVFIALGSLFFCNPLFRLAFGVNATTPLRGKAAFVAGWAVAKERTIEIFALAIILVVASLIASVFGMMLNAPIPSSFDLGSFDINSLGKLDVSQVIKMLTKPDDKPLWVSFYSPVADAVTTAIKEGFAYTLLCVWFARRSVPSPVV